MLAPSPAILEDGGSVPRPVDNSALRGIMPLAQCDVACWAVLSVGLGVRVDVLLCHPARVKGEEVIEQSDLTR
jgi:hypothetical protein